MSTHPQELLLRLEQLLAADPFVRPSRYAPLFSACHETIVRLCGPDLSCSSCKKKQNQIKNLEDRCLELVKERDQLANLLADIRDLAMRAK